jgi:hypothetical protein
LSSQKEPRPQENRKKGTQLFSAGASTLFRVSILGVVLLVAASATVTYAYFHSSYWSREGVAPIQPILFSHRHHAGELRIDCRNCHSTVENSAFAGMPSTRTCLTCHSRIFTATTMIRPLVESAARNEPIEWNRVNRLPDHVFFNHGIHVAKGVACISCHGEVGKMALMVKGEPLTMRWCLDCHRDPAPRLSEPSAIFQSVLTGVPSARTSAELAAYFHIETDSLTNCSTCHH